MKKFILSILASLYLLASSGTAVQLHYCMGKMVDWSLAHTSSASCNQCGMDKQESGNNCCKDEQKYIKSVDDQKAGSGQYVFTPLAIATQPSPFPLLSITFTDEGCNYVGSPNGPPLHTPERYLRHRSLLL